MKPGYSRRKNPRFSINIDGYYFKNDDWEKCRIYDLNLEGAGLKINEIFQNDEVVKIKIDFQSEEYIFKTVVVNQREKRYGIKFIDLKFDELEILKMIINQFADRYKI